MKRVHEFNPLRRVLRLQKLVLCNTLIWVLACQGCKITSVEQPANHIYFVVVILSGNTRAQTLFKNPHIFILYTEFCFLRRNGYYPNPTGSGCKHFYYCYKKSTYPRKCGGDTVFDSVASRCKAQDDVDCSKY